MGKTYGKSTIYCAIQVSRGCRRRVKPLGDERCTKLARSSNVCEQKEDTSDTAEDPGALEAEIKELQSEETKLKEDLKVLAIRELSEGLDLARCDSESEVLTLDRQGRAVAHPEDRRARIRPSRYGEQGKF